MNVEWRHLVGGNRIAIPPLFLDEQLSHSLLRHFLHSANLPNHHSVKGLRIAYSTTGVIAKFPPNKFTLYLFTHRSSISSLL
ncbi:hypothetical protein E1A91_A11G135100v1 [Gossypium mustelinum]|uniref:Uncharacterized protein n=1 Tax=Gossypium mustelinum TaxID=34275 RepID=A0A5D2X639_GOSMU|nr:hypothetical protein E1A91_A11G135100v1 [Gossypium mustelinum]